MCSTIGRLRVVTGAAVFLLLPLRAQAPQCDVNGDGVVDVRDVQIVLQAALGARARQSSRRATYSRQYPVPLPEGTC